MAEAVTHGVMTAQAIFQTQVAGFMAVLQGVEGHQALHFAKEQAEDPLRFQAGLQLQIQLLAQLRKADGSAGDDGRLAKAQALQFGTVEVNCVGLGRCFHKRAGL